MSHILGIWELGDDLGHLHRLAELASALTTRGHQVSLIVKDLSRAEMFFRESAVRIYQAPVWIHRPSSPRLTKTMADILAYKGYGEVDGLMALVKAWRALLDLLQPDLMVFDFAPTAMLAAGDSHVAKIIFSSSFSSPTPGVSGVDLCPWVPVKPEAVDQAEQFVVGNINTVARQQALPPVRFVGDLFRGAETFLADLPLFDMYGDVRKNATYTGPPRASSSFQTCDWGNAPGKKIFAYLKPGRPHVDTALHILAHSQANVRVYYPGKLPAALQGRQSTNFKVSDKPFELTDVMNTADAVVSHGGVGVASSSLLSGLPLLVLPTHLEQKNNAMQIHQAHLGTWIAQERAKAETEKIVQAFVDNTTYSANVSAFAEKNESISMINAIELVADACDRNLDSRA
ncbi:nucleotide disphospho-sugar-binding domain-containing protein [Allohahella sp. A8]|uniref:nucleotide disphospho-sugar-binding domain-containing protein n=1 Tax=Allohahella sp. A8 TaxID=3141461 RepID=UPI003A7FEDE3